jgi:hypothetical protein
MGVPNTSGEWDIYAVGINLRLTATTHPSVTLKLLTHGDTDEISDIFHTLIESPPGPYLSTTDQ